MTMYERKVRMSAAQPKGDQNGFTQPDVLEALTRGFGREQKHIAVIEFYVSDQTTSAATGTVTNVIALNRIEVVEGQDAEQAVRILRDTFTARQPDPLPGMGGADNSVMNEDIGGRDSE